LPMPRESQRSLTSLPSITTRRLASARTFHAACTASHAHRPTQLSQLQEKTDSKQKYIVCKDFITYKKAYELQVGLAPPATAPTPPPPQPFDHAAHLLHSNRSSTSRPLPVCLCVCAARQVRMPALAASTPCWPVTFRQALQTHRTLSTLFSHLPHAQARALHPLPSRVPPRTLGQARQPRREPRELRCRDSSAFLTYQSSPLSSH
jgi:hypothetical protein